MVEERNEVFRAAKDYFAAAARYWRAAHQGADMETPTQEQVGHGLFYHLALQRYAVAATGADAEFASRRLAHLRQHIEYTAARYMVDRRIERFLDKMRDGVELIAEERDKFVNVFRHAPEAWLLTNRLGMIRETNLAAAETFGMRPRLPIGIYILPSDRRAFRLHLYKADTEWDSRLKGGGEAHFQVRQSTLGELHWMVRAA